MIQEENDNFQEANLDQIEDLILDPEIVEEQRILFHLGRQINQRRMDREREEVDDAPVQNHRFAIKI